MDSDKIKPFNGTTFENTLRLIHRHTEHLEFDRFGQVILGFEHKSIRKERRLKFWIDKIGKKHYFNFNDLHREAYHRQLNRKCAINLRTGEVTRGQPTSQWKSVY